MGACRSLPAGAVGVVGAARCWSRAPRRRARQAVRATRAGALAPGSKSAHPPPTRRARPRQPPRLPLARRTCCATRPPSRRWRSSARRPATRTPTSRWAGGGPWGACSARAGVPAGVAGRAWSEASSIRAGGRLPLQMTLWEGCRRLLWGERAAAGDAPPHTAFCCCLLQPRAAAPPCRAAGRALQARDHGRVELRPQLEPAAAARVQARRLLLRQGARATGGLRRPRGSHAGARPTRMHLSAGSHVSWLACQLAPLLRPCAAHPTCRSTPAGLVRAGAESASLDSPAPLRCLVTHCSPPTLSAPRRSTTSWRRSARGRASRATSRWCVGLCSRLPCPRRTAAALCHAPGASTRLGLARQQQPAGCPRRPTPAQPTPKRPAPSSPRPPALLTAN